MFAHNKKMPLLLIMGCYILFAAALILTLYNEIRYDKLHLQWYFSWKYSRSWEDRMRKNKASAKTRSQ